MDASQFNLSVGSSICTSTPFKVPASRRKGKASTRSKSFVRPVCDTCPFCGKEYRCHRSFLNHKRQHTIKEANSSYPNVQQITEHCSASASEAISVLESYPAYGVVGQKYRELLTNLKSLLSSNTVSPEWHRFLEIIYSSLTKNLGENKILLPSALATLLVKNCELLLSDIDKRKEMFDALQSVMVCETQVCHSFISDYVRVYVKVILKYFSSCLKVVQNEDNNNNDTDFTLDHEDKETIHYIAGSVVRGFYKRSCEYPKNVFWVNVNKLIVGKLLESDSVEGPPAVVKGWTTARDKGRLFFVSGKLFDFFVGITEILRRVTHKKFNIDYQRVIEVTCQGVVVLLWDEAVGDSLSESASYELMCAMIRSFCNTFGVGKAKELINKYRPNKAEASIPLRHKVAPRQKT